MIPQQWPREEPLDKLNEIRDQQLSPRERRRRGQPSRRASASSRIAGLIGIATLTIVAIVVVVSLALAFGYH